MDYQAFQSQYDKIYSYFKTTTESFYFLEWDGKVLQVWNNNMVIEVYSLKDLSFMLEIGKV